MCPQLETGQNAGDDVKQCVGGVHGKIETYVTSAVAAAPDCIEGASWSEQ